MMPAREDHDEGIGLLRVQLHRRVVGQVGQAPFRPELLTATEHSACARMLRPADAALCRESRFLLRQTLGSLLDRDPASLMFCLGPAGKPSLQGVALPFNLSHSGGIALLAVTAAPDVELGVDVEAADRSISDTLLRAVLAPGELRALLALPEAPRRAGFLRLWTLKEAVLKASGLGLSAAPDQVVFDVASDWLLDVPAPLGAAGDYTVEVADVGTAWHAALAVRDGRRRALTVEVLPPL